MDKRRAAKQPDYRWEVEFAREVRQLPPAARRDLLAWLRRWRRRPERIFWEVTPTGERRRL